MDAETENKLEAIKLIEADVVSAHKTLFAHRHTESSPPAHDQTIRDMHSTVPRLVVEAHRGFAKSTLAEEAITLMSALKKYNYLIILGNTYDRAAQRLASIKNEINNNAYLFTIFGDLKGSIWNENKVKLANNTVIQCFGARQSIRGVKEDVRPDFALIDDLEDPDWVKSPAAVAENKHWFTTEFLPALQSPLRTPIRMLGTPLADNCLLRQLAASEGWVHRFYPVKFVDPDTSEWTPTWPTKFPLEDINAIEQSMIAINDHRSFMQEYMCVSESEQELIFKPEQFRYNPDKSKAWQAVQVFIDPARTTVVGRSAMTGWAAWSWGVGGKLTVWEAGGDYLMPDEVIDLAFRLNDQWQPVELGFEEDGLNEWALQPFRQAQVQRGSLPLRPVRAPRGKLDFIKGLQPYFSSGAVELVGTRDSFKNLTDQLVQFPRGLKDVPNALAYALLMRLGRPVVEDFTNAAIFPAGDVIRAHPVWLAANADGRFVTACLCQDAQGVVRVLADWVVEGQPADAVDGIVRDAGRRAAQKLYVVTPPKHLDTYRNVGLNQALVRAGLRPKTGSAPEQGRVDMQAMLRRHIRGGPALQVSDNAGWVLRGLTAGYAYEIMPGNVIATEPKKGLYRTLIEGLESFCGTSAYIQSDAEDGNYRFTEDGRRYRSAMK